MHKGGLLISAVILAWGLALPPGRLLGQKDETQNASPLTVSPAADGIFRAFQQRPIVALSDDHRMAQEEDFYASLIRDTRFAESVGNVVVEFGDAAQQTTIDRYLAGEEIPYEELRRVWSDTVGWIPTVNALGYLNFFAQVRAVNRGLPLEKRIRVWLGDPPIDWSKTKTKEDFLPKLGDRDGYPARILKKEILAKGKKALVIYGGFHFYGENSLRSRVKRDYPNSFYLVTAYRGFVDLKCSKAFEAEIQDWPNPALAGPVHGTRVEGLLRSSGCYFLAPGSIHFGANVAQAEIDKQMAVLDGHMSGVDGDALLFLGPASSLTYSPAPGDLYLDLAFRKEIERRLLLQFGQSLDDQIPEITPQFLHGSAAK